MIMIYHNEYIIISIFTPFTPEHDIIVSNLAEPLCKSSNLTTHVIYELFVIEYYHAILLSLHNYKQIAIRDIGAFCSSVCLCSSSLGMLK